MPNLNLLFVFPIAASFMLFQANTHAAKLTAGADYRIDEVLGVDQIVTGRQVSREHLARWHEARIKFDACGSCGPKQPYPGDEPAIQLNDQTVTGSIKADTR